MLTNDQMIVRCGAIRDQVLEFCREHERTDHAGEPCYGNRASVVAYLAHTLGLQNLQALGYVAGLLQEYNERCLGCPGERDAAPEKGE